MKLDELETNLGHRFQDPALLETSITHASRAAETGGDRGGERLEFLGDAVLDLVVAEILFEAHSDWDEGKLTRARASLVNREALARCARRIDLGRFLRLGRTEERTAGGEKDTVLADAFEAVIGAVYLDAGLAPVEAIVRDLFGAALREGPRRDPKTAFQEWAHAARSATPVYRTVFDSQAEEDDQRFTVEVRLDEEVWGEGIGRSKRLAEREAARTALERVADEDV